MLQDQGINVPLQMYGNLQLNLQLNLQSEYVPGNILNKWSVTVVWSILEIYLLCTYCLQSRTDHWKVFHVYEIAAADAAVLAFITHFIWPLAGLGEHSTCTNLQM